MNLSASTTSQATSAATARASLETCAELFKREERANYFEACGYELAEFIALDTT